MNIWITIVFLVSLHPLFVINYAYSAKTNIKGIDLSEQKYFLGADNSIYRNKPPCLLFKQATQSDIEKLPKHKRKELKRLCQNTLIHERQNLRCKTLSDFKIDTLHLNKVNKQKVSTKKQRQSATQQREELTSLNPLEAAQALVILTTGIAKKIATNKGKSQSHQHKLHPPFSCSPAMLH